MIFFSSEYKYISLCLLVNVALVFCNLLAYNFSLGVSRGIPIVTICQKNLLWSVVHECTIGGCQAPTYTPLSKSDVGLLGVHNAPPLPACVCHG